MTESITANDSEILRRQFEDASSRWPNLESVLVLWTGDEKPKLSKHLGPQVDYAIPCDGWTTINGERVRLGGVWTDAGLHGAVLDNPPSRFRTGYSGMLYTRRHFGRFMGAKDEPGDADEATGIFQRLLYLATLGNALIDNLGGAGLSEDTLRRKSIVRWQLAVHEILKTPRSPMAKTTNAWCEHLPDLFLASAQSVWRLKPVVVRGNEARDKYIYEQALAGTIWKAIEAEVRKSEEWDDISMQRIQQVAREYAVAHNKPLVPPRKRGRPAKS